MSGGPEPLAPVEAPEGTEGTQDPAEAAQDGPAGAEGAAEVMPDASPEDLRAEVRRLRDENAAARTSRKAIEQAAEQASEQATETARRLHVELVRATGRLADPDDLPFDAAHLDDPEVLTAAVDELLERKPHLASRRPSGDVGQGARPEVAVPSLAAMLRAGAG